MDEENEVIGGRARRTHGACLAAFDLDGTLVDTLGGLAGAANRALEDFDYPTHPIADYRHMVGNGAAKLMERALPETARQLSEIQLLYTRFTEYYNDSCLQTSPPYAGVPEMLASLREGGVRLAVITNKPHPFAQRIVSGMLGGAFCAVLGQRDGVPVKPDPSAVFEAMRMAGVDGARTAYIGDSDVDVHTGKNAGLFVIGCAWGFRGEAELVRAGADVIARHPSDVAREMFRRF